MSAISTATAGIIDATSRFDRAAVRGIESISTGGDILSDFVEQMQARQALSANISVIRASNDMTGRLLDIRA